MFLENRFAETIWKKRPDAQANLAGSPAYPNIKGAVSFYQTNRGVIVVAEVTGLPRGDGDCQEKVFALHLHEGESCTGTGAEPFADAGKHYNPEDCPHPQHAGDLPPLFENHGYAWYAVLTNRFEVEDVIGRTAIVHLKPDDFTTQPSGNAGEMIACGVIE